MRSRPARLAASTVAVAALATALIAAAPAPALHPRSPRAARPAAVVSLGDSFISGEAGRWQGNGGTVDGSRYGTDRAAYDCDEEETSCSYDPKRVYGDSYDDGCNRSDAAEITHVVKVRVASTTYQIARGDRVNIACSGATTDAIVKDSFKGEPRQLDQLAGQAAKYDVKLVALSIGGNDIKFSDIIKSCVTRFSTGLGYCHKAWESEVPTLISNMETAVRETLRQIRATMKKAGYAEDAYRLVVQSYPAPIPLGKDNRYSEKNYDRLNVGGCPFYDQDSDWAHDELVPALDKALTDAAAATPGVQILHMTQALDGHEVCAKTAEQSAAGNTLRDPLPADRSEWVRFLTTGLAQGQAQESLHPNFYGQRRLGGCLNAFAESAARAWSCHD
jgi:hypothetical protein